jgi:hypothetical protein
MMYRLHLFDKPGKDRSAAVVQRQTHSGQTLNEAVQAAKVIVARSSALGIHGFCLFDREDTEVFRWFTGDDHI